MREHEFFINSCCFRFRMECNYIFGRVSMIIRLHLEDGNDCDNDGTVPNKKHMQFNELSYRVHVPS